MKLAIIGYGNLGKSLEKAIEQDCATELVGIYSRRSLDNGRYRPLAEIAKAKDVDVLLIAQGSWHDVRENAELFKQFDTVDSFDTHADINSYKAQLNGINRDRICIVGAGWDPGTLSLIRGVASVAGTPVTMWGRGISQGHSNAVRSIAGVLDAVQFTVPKVDCKAKLEQGITDSAKLHDRLVYAACVEQDKEEVEQKIKSIPNYFADYDTTVQFVTPSEIRQLKGDTRHRGQVYCKGRGYTMDCTLNVDCNTDLTATIMLKYAKAIAQLKRDGYTGALDVFDIPLKYVADSHLV